METQPNRATARSLTLRNGRQALIRPQRADDSVLLLDLFARLSGESRYRRFLSPMPVLSPLMLERLAAVDGDSHFGWVALDGDRCIGAGRWIRIRSDPGAAEVALAVADTHQRSGLGRGLLAAIAESAGQCGVRTLRATVLAENLPAIGLLRGSGFRGVRWSGPVVELSSERSERCLPL
jgi:L-amino acid N-acyltransferase YncA